MLFRSFGLQEAGISARTIERSARFGHALRAALPALEGTDDGPFLVGLKAVTVQPPTLLAERIAFRSFRIWGRLIRAAGRPGSTARKPIIAIYVAFLVAIILTLLPFTTMLLAIKARFSRTIRREVAALELPSGSGSECLALYERPT